jgi:hypothetical protein
VIQLEPGSPLFTLSEFKWSRVRRHVALAGGGSTPNGIELSRLASPDLVSR